jgi:delta24-sterol reductase
LTVEGLNSNTQVLVVEPGIEMGALTHQLLGLGWTIPVIPEFESLTVGKTTENYILKNT